MRPSATLDPLFQQALEATKHHSKSFYFATRFFPRELARSAHAVYWFCRHTDDLVDECASIEEGRANLEAWAAQVRAGLRGEPVSDPILQLFLETKRRYGIPDEYPLELIEGMRMDLEGTRYQTFEELRVFCYRVASVVGLMMSHVIGFKGDALPYAIDLGIAMQLTNILRDVGEDLGRGRIYLPAEDLERFGYSEQELRNRVQNDAFVGLMQFQIERARGFYKRATPGISMLSPKGRFAVQIAADVYSDILKRIEKNGYDVFGRRAFVPSAKKYALMSKALLEPVVQQSSLLTLAALLLNYVAFYLFSTPLITEIIGEWIMKHTPSAAAVWILATFGAWAKPFAMTGALAAVGFVFFLALLPFRQSFAPPRRKFLTQAFMVSGVVAIAGESYLREKALAQRAAKPVALFPFQPPPEQFHAGFVRRAVTPIPEFYGMSKNTVDPATDPRVWQLRISVDGKTVKQFRYSELLAMPRTERFVTLRCVSNTLKSDLMGTAAWSGVRLSQLINRDQLPANITEAAIVGVDGHGDSMRLDVAFSDEVIFALGMNGQTLDRVHGFPIRLLTPRYYGFKNVKWIGEIAFVSQPYFGTWPKMGYTKEPVVHVASHIDKVQPAADILKVGGVSFAGTRGIEQVRVRADQGPWVMATLDSTLSPYTWTRWYVELPTAHANQIEAQAQDGTGHWQEQTEGPLFPDGVTGPTIRRVG